MNLDGVLVTFTRLAPALGLALSSKNGNSVLSGCVGRRSRLFTTFPVNTGFYTSDDVFSEMSEATRHGRIGHLY